jgi:hypothetical protein
MRRTGVLVLLGLSACATPVANKLPAPEQVLAECRAREASGEAGFSLEACMERRALFFSSDECRPTAGHPTPEQLHDAKCYRWMIAE